MGVGRGQGGAPTAIKAEARKASLYSTGGASSKTQRGQAPHQALRVLYASSGLSYESHICQGPILTVVGAVSELHPSSPCGKKGPHAPTVGSACAMQDRVKGGCTCLGTCWPRSTISLPSSLGAPESHTEGEDDPAAPLIPHLQDMQLGNPRPVRKTQEPEQAAQNRLFPGTFYGHPYSSRLHTQWRLAHALARHTWVLGAQSIHIDARQGEGAWAGAGRASGASGIVQQPYFCQLGTSPRGRSHENPESAPSELQLFMWFQLARAIRDFKAVPAKDGLACLCLHLSQRLSGPLPES